MPHFRVDDGLNNHPKARKAGLEAMGLWSLCGSYCMAYLTDGFVPEWYVATWPKGAALAKKLVTAGFWHPAERDSENGWQFHEFLGPGRQDSKAQIEADREKWRKKKQSQRGDSPGVSPGDTRGDTTGDAPRDTRGESPEGSSRATRDPTQPNVKKNSGYVLESATDSNARDAISATPGADLVRQIIPRDIPDATRTALRHQASALINNGTPHAVVEESLHDWLAKTGVGPGLLPSLAADVVKRRNGHANGKPTSKVRSLAELAQETRATERAQLETATPKELNA